MWLYDKVIEFIKDPSGLKKEVEHINVNLLHAKKEVINEVHEGVMELKKELSKPVTEVIADYKLQLEEVTKKAEFYCMSLNNIGDVMPDMLWFKYIDGTYAFTNKAIRDGLLFDDSPIGKTDGEMGQIAVSRFGENNHNFGKYCAGSDDVVIDYGHRKRFIEYGMSGGKPLVLEVYKNVVRNTDREIIGTVGSGRDITEMLFTMFSLAECSIDTKDRRSCEILDKFLGKYLYENSAMDNSLNEFYKQHKGSLDG